MIAPLPPSVISANPLLQDLRATGRTPESELSRDPFVRLILLQPNVDKEGLSPIQVMGLLALATQMPVDPRAVIQPEEMGNLGLSHPVSLLALVLNRTPGFGARRPMRQWPTALAEFGPHLLQTFEDPFFKRERQDAIDTEWLGAVLLAAGADPWACPSTAYPYGQAIAEAITHNLSGLVHRLFDCPHAPTVQQVFDSLPASVTKTLFASSSHAPTLKELFQRGLQLSDSEESWTLLPGASPEVLEMMANLGKLPTQETTQKRLLSAWRDRVLTARDGSWPAETCGRMNVLLTGISPAQAMRERMSIEFLQTLNESKWNDSVGPVRESHNSAYCGNKGVEWLCSKAPILYGPNAGQWSGVAVLVAKRLRQAFCHADQRGLPVWDMAAAVSFDFVPETEGAYTGKWRSGPAEDFAGSLAQARGFDWRPGIAIDGLMALGLLGMAVHPFSSKLPLDVLDVEQAQRHAEILLGVPSLRAWATLHAEAAVAFTEEMARQKKPKISKALLWTWATALSNHPTWLAHDPSLAPRLVRALHGSFSGLKLEDPMESGVAVIPAIFPPLGQQPLGDLWGSVLKAIAPWFSEDEEPEWTALDPQQRQLAIDMALLLKRPRWIATLETLAEQGLLNEEDAKNIQMRVEAKRSPADQPIHPPAQEEAFVAQLKNLVLNIRLAHVDVSVKRGRGARL